MVKDEIKEEVERTIHNLEDHLKKQGFMDSDIDELKADLEVEIKKKSSLAEIVGVIKTAQKKIQNKNGKKVFSDESTFDRLKDDFKDYDSGAGLEEQIDFEEIERIEDLEINPALEEKVNINNKYFSQGSNSDSLDIEYLKSNDVEYVQGGTELKKDTDQIINESREKEKEEIAYRTTGKVKKETYSSGSEDPSSVYR